MNSNQPPVFSRWLLGLLLCLSSAWANAGIARSVFTTGISEREPVDSISHTPAGHSIYLFTDIRNLKGHTISHRWIHKGKIYMDIPFNIDGQRWRVYSQKTLPKGLTGEWIVQIIDQSENKLLKQLSIQVQQHSKPAKPPLATTAPSTNIGMNSENVINLTPSNGDNTATPQRVSGTETSSPNANNKSQGDRRVPIWEVLPR